MIISASIDFWGDGVVCFCHETLTRAVAEAFPDAQFEPLDVAGDGEFDLNCPRLRRQMKCSPITIDK